MTEQQIPARIWARNPNGKCVVSFTIGDFDYKTPYIRSDIAERMAEALERVDAAWTRDFPDGPDGSRDFLGGIGQLSDWSIETWKQIRSALSAFRSATQDTEARHDDL